MQKYQVRFLLGLTLWLVCSQFVEAAPRGRRLSRRARAAATSHSHRNYVVYHGDTSTVASQVIADPWSPPSSPLDVGDALPSDPEILAVADHQVVPAVHEEVAESAETTPAVSSESTTPESAMDEVNAIRAQQGLPEFIEDPSLTAVAYSKAAIQANRGAMGHPGGSMGGARYEGVGMGYRFTTCYLYSNAGRYAGAATVVGRNGQRYHCLLIR